MANTIAPAATSSPAQLERRLRQAAPILALAALGYLGLAVLADTATVLGGLQRLGPGQWLTLLGLSLVNYGLRFVRWHGYLGLLGARVPVGRDLAIYVAGFAFTISPGKAGEAVRSVYLRTEGVPWSSGLAALATERLLDLAATALLAALALRVFSAQVPLVIATVLLATALLYLITRPRVGHWLLARLPESGPMGRLASGAGAILDDARVLLGLRPLLGGLALGLLAWGAEAWGLYLLLGWLGVGMEPLHAMGIYAASMIAGALSFLPGGLGGAEAAMVALLLASGATFGAAAAATLICRAATLWFALLLGIGAVFFLGRR